MSAIKAQEAWLAEVEVAGHGLASEESLSAADCAEEYLLMGLRLSEGIDLARLTAIGGSALDEARIGALESQGLLARLDSRLAATTQGRLGVKPAVIESSAPRDDVAH